MFEKSSAHHLVLFSHHQQQANQPASQSYVGTVHLERVSPDDGTFDKHFPNPKLNNSSYHIARCMLLSTLLGGFPHVVFL